MPSDYRRDMKVRLLRAQGHWQQIDLRTFEAICAMSEIP